MFLFPVKAIVYVLIIGAMAFFAALSASGGPVSNLAHLGGLVVGWLYLSGPRDLRLRSAVSVVALAHGADAAPLQRAQGRPGRLGQSHSLTPGRRLLIAGLLAGAIIRAIALPLPGTGDVLIWKVWSFAGAYDVTAMYGVGGIPPERRVLHWRGAEMTVDYPPVASLRTLARSAGSIGLFVPAFDDSRALNAFVKLPGLLAEMALVAVILFRGGDGSAAPQITWAALAVWLNPAEPSRRPGARLSGSADGRSARPRGPLRFRSIGRGWPVRCRARGRDESASGFRGAGRWRAHSLAIVEAARRPAAEARPLGHRRRSARPAAVRDPRRLAQSHAGAWRIWPRTTCSPRKQPTSGGSSPGSCAS